MARLSIVPIGVRYEIVGTIAEGGMGIVYEALQLGARNFAKRVAIKVIRPRFGAHQQFLENFIGEVKLVADLIHTNSTADELLNDLEYSIYRAGYGPTNETLGRLVRQLFGKNPR